MLSLSLLRNLLIDFIIVYLKYSILPLRFYTSYYNTYLSILATYIINFN